MRTASLIMLSALFGQAAHADEIRHTTFPNVILSRVVVMIIADDVALAFSLFSLIAVFIKVRRQHK
jgi:hypothetical protein